MATKYSTAPELALRRKMIIMIGGLIEQIEREGLDDPQAVVSLIDHLMRQGYDKEARSLSHAFAKQLDRINVIEVSRILKQHLGIDAKDLIASSSQAVVDKLQQLTEANVALIKSVRVDLLDRVRREVTQGALAGELADQIRKRIQAVADVSESRAKLIARDQVSKYNNALTRARHEQVGIKRYRWSASGDERTRDSHQRLDGKIFEYDNPPSIGNPGDDYNCRCIAIPVLDNED